MLADAGYYVSSQQQNTELMCAAGTYSSAAGADACDTCPPGYYSPGTTAIVPSTTCTPCS